MFIGQSHIVAQLQFILPATYEIGSANLLFRGPSGYGKTELAMIVANYYAKNQYIMKLGHLLEFQEDKRVHLIDEIHLCPSFEFWYPIMDRNRHILIFTTNADSVLPEAFVRRCYDFVFTDYTNDELIEIVRSRQYFNITDEQILYVIEFCHGSPALVLSIVRRLDMWSTQNYNISSMSLNEFKELVSRIFGVIDGIDPLQRRYLEVLRRFGGTSSVTNIQNALHLDLGTIKRDIEPALLDKGLIRISSKGRSVV